MAVEKIPSVFQLPKLRGHDVAEISIRQLQRHFALGHFSAVDYVEYSLNLVRICNPYLEAIIETNPDAMTIAKSLDEERLAGGRQGLLHGIPVLVKDNTATKDAMQTTAGSWSLLGSTVCEDAFIVSKLRKAGAIILGKANMSEWASVRSKTYSTGFSPRGGQVRNPFDLHKSPFGSSSGSAVAVSANLVPISFGTETDTSIIGPASANGVVGLKPTVGLTSRHGVIPISHNMDSVGSFGRTVEDAVIALNAISGYDPQDHVESHPPNRRECSNYMECLSTSEVLRGAHFGLPNRRCWDLVPPSCKLIAEKVLNALRRAGATIHPVEFPSIEERTNPRGTWDWEHGGDPARSEWTVAKVDAYNDINAYLRTHLTTSLVRTIEDVVRYNEENTGTEGGVPGMVRAFPDGQPNFAEIVAAKGKEDATYQAALAHIRRQTRENGIDAALRSGYGGTDTLDQTEKEDTAPLPPEQELDGLLFFDRRGIGQQYAAQAGYPIICIPIGLDTHQMPVSLSIQHTAWREGTLIRWASAIEDLWARENGSRPTPTFRNHLAKIIPIEGFEE